MRYTLARGLSEPVVKPDVILVGNGRRLVYRRGSTTPALVVNQKEIIFTEVSNKYRFCTILRYFYNDDIQFCRKILSKKFQISLMNHDESIQNHAIHHLSKINCNKYLYMSMCQ